MRMGGEGDGVGGNAPKDDRSLNAVGYAGFCRVSTAPYSELTLTFWKAISKGIE
jgi:hypothetical protein